MSTASSSQKFQERGLSLRPNREMNPLSPFIWSDKRFRAAELLSEGRHSFATITKTVPINRNSLIRWQSHPTFQQKVADLQAEFVNRVHGRYFARRVGRANALMDRIEEIEQIWQARAATFVGAPDEEASGGGATGHIVRHVRGIGGGIFLEKVIDYKADTALIQEYRALNDQVSRELGQHEQRLEVSGSIGSIRVTEVVIRLNAGTDDALAEAADSYVEANYSVIDGGQAEAEAQEEE